jgi:O-antigen/teichoic acid export membrane protein
MSHPILSLGKDSLIYGVGSFISRFIGLITLPLFTSYLSTAEYGVLAMLGLVTMVAQPVFSLGLAAAMGPSYFRRDCPLNKSKAVWSVFTINAASVTVMLAVAWLFPEMIGRMVLLRPEHSHLIRFSLTGCAFTILGTSFTQLVQFERQVKFYVGVTLCSSLLAIFTSIVLVVFQGMGMEGMVIGQFGGSAANFLGFFIIGLKKSKVSVTFEMMRELLHRGFPLVPSFAFLFILMHGNKYILERCVGLEAVGIYSVGFNLGMTITMITGGIASAWHPFFMGYVNRQAEAVRIFSRVTTYYVLGVGFICVLFSLLAKPVVLISLDEKFHETHVIVGLVAAANCLQGLFNILLPGLYYNDEIKYVSLVQFFSALVSVPVTHVFVSQFGVVGAGIGLVGGNFLMVIAMYIWNYCNKKRYPDVSYEWSRMALFVLWCALILCSYAGMSVETLRAEIYKSFLFGILSFAVFGFILTKEEKIVLFRRKDSV